MKRLLIFKKNCSMKGIMQKKATVVEMITSIFLLMRI